MNLCKVWVERCKAAKAIEDEFGTQKALAYPVGEKFLNYLETAAEDSTFQAGPPAFVAEVKRLFGPRQPAECPGAARQTEPFDAGTYERPSKARHITLGRAFSVQGTLPPERFRPG
jgi:hypothetical protein